jgi:predicted KAP-like P-loop ATPase
VVCLFKEEKTHGKIKNHMETWDSLIEKEQILIQRINELDRWIEQTLKGRSKTYFVMRVFFFIEHG